MQKLTDHEQSLDELIYGIMEARAIANRHTRWYQHVANDIHSLLTFLYNLIPHKQDEWTRISEEMDDAVWRTIKERRKNNLMREFYNQARYKVAYHMMPKTIEVKTINQEDVA